MTGSFILAHRSTFFPFPPYSGARTSVFTSVL